jgi:hypothetical protein
MIVALSAVYSAPLFAFSRAADQNTMETSMQDLIRSIEAVITDMRDTVVWMAPDTLDDDTLVNFLANTLGIARINRARLSTIELDLDRHKHFAHNYWHIPVSASPQPGVIRLTFDPVNPHAF